MFGDGVALSVLACMACACGRVGFDVSEGNADARVERDCSLEAPRSIATGYNASPVVLADLDHAGGDELVFGNCCATAQDQIGVMRELGGGTYGPRTDIAVPHFVESILVSDMTHDGQVDLVLTTGTNTARDVSTLVSNGDGTLQGPSNYLPFVTTGHAAPADFNHDGNTDLVIAGWDCNCVEVLLGDGAGGYLAEDLSPTPSGTIRVATADLDRDGSDDVIAASLLGMAMYTLRNNGDGTFQQAVTYPLGVPLVGDFDSDGIVDVATGSGVMYGVGDGTLLQPVQVPGFVDPSTTGDLDNDGVPDLVGSITGGVSVGYARPDRTFRRVDTPIAIAAKSLTVGDVDGDGYRDIVASNTTAPSVQWLRGACR